jgi:cysteine synthase A
LLPASDRDERLDALKTLIGNTPLLAIKLRFRGEHRVVYAKAENLNMTGSVKDRMAYHIVREAYTRDVLRPGMRIIEATSGNTGISFCAVGRALGHSVTIFMPDWMSQERVNLIRSFGAEIRMISHEQGGFVGSIQRAEMMALESDLSFLPRQFSNEENSAAHHETTGPEIWWQLQSAGLTPDALVAGVGTGGTIMGAGGFLREMNPTVKLYPVEPASSPTLSTGRQVGSHRIQGISDEFIPPIVHLEDLDDVLAVDDGDSIIMAQKLARGLGLAVGISSGANFIGALLAQEKLGADAVVATLFPDSNKKYLSTDLLRKEPVEPEFLSTDVELLSFTSLRRVCHMCVTDGSSD